MNGAAAEAGFGGGNWDLRFAVCCSWPGLGCLADLKGIERHGVDGTRKGMGPVRVL